jgi:hypothetical protein
MTVPMMASSKKLESHIRPVWYVRELRIHHVRKLRMRRYPKNSRMETLSSGMRPYQTRNATKNGFAEWLVH